MLRAVTLNRRIIFGNNSLESLGVELRAFCSRAFVVTYTAGKVWRDKVVEKVINILEDSQIKYELFREVTSTPQIQLIDKGSELCKKAKCDAVIGLGGGSVIDSAKAIAILITNNGSIRQYQMGDKTIEVPGLPIVAVPTAPGSGSEATAVAVIDNMEAGIKKSISSTYMVPQFVFIDPLLSVNLPPYLTATMGMDVLSHAIESFVSKQAYPFSEAVSVAAIRLVGISLRRAVFNGLDEDARSNMSWASYLGGLSLSAGVGAVHILAQPLSAVREISHSEAVSALLPEVMGFNLNYAQRKYAQIASFLGEKIEAMSVKNAALAAIRNVDKLCEDIGVKRSLKDHGFSKADIPKIIEKVTRSTSHIITNPRPVDEEALSYILGSCLES
ncbi:MAG: iron-containing alcohol dehydrogenase [Actinobacteria bacterium]|nr:iron-containing alcohol dehydrogenase [Actinomycetota bacterium]